MEKRGETTEYDIRQLIKYASSEGRVVVINMDGFMKQAGGKKDRKAFILIATGDNAEQLREALGPIFGD